MQNYYKGQLNFVILENSDHGEAQFLENKHCL